MGHIVSLVWNEKEQGSKYRAQSWLSGSWLTTHTVGPPHPWVGQPQVQPTVDQVQPLVR